VEDASFQRLLRRARNDRGLDLSGYKPAFVLRRLKSRFRALEIESLDEYNMILKRNPDEYEKLLEALAINVTEFFRDPSLYETFSRDIIRDILERKSRLSVKTFRIFCAGGASGEEPYSIAITLLETLGKRIEDYTVTIHTIDIDEDCIRKTKVGAYPPDRLRNVSSEIARKYFTEENGSYVIKPTIRKMVTAYHLDLLTARIPKFFDVVFCRNVLIYMSKEAHTDLFLKFHTALLDDGFLILGRTETLIGISKQLFKIHNARERIYRKIGRTGVK